MKLYLRFKDGTEMDLRDVVSFSLDEWGDVAVDYDSYGDSTAHYSGVEAVTAEA